MIPKSPHFPLLVVIPYICSSTYLPEMSGPIGLPSQEVLKHEPWKVILEQPLHRNLHTIDSESNPSGNPWAIKHITCVVDDGEFI
jgi:hypothetical protein